MKKDNDKICAFIGALWLGIGILTGLVLLVAVPHLISDIIHPKEEVCVSLFADLTTDTIIYRYRPCGASSIKTKSLIPVDHLIVKDDSGDSIFSIDPATGLASPIGDPVPFNNCTKVECCHRPFTTLSEERPGYVYTNDGSCSIGRPEASIGLFLNMILLFVGIALCLTLISVGFRAFWTSSGVKKD